MIFELLYPELKVVTGKIIEGWYFDAVANNEIAPPYTSDVREMAVALQDIGYITIRRKESK